MTADQATTAEPTVAERLGRADDPERLAQAFHEVYEELAPSFGYETREASAKPWAEVPEPNRSLMVAVAARVMGPLARAARDGVDARATLEAFEDAIGRAGRMWRTPEGQVVILDGESDLDPADFLPEGSVELVPASPCSQCGATS